MEGIKTDAEEQVEYLSPTRYRYPQLSVIDAAMSVGPFTLTGLASSSRGQGQSARPRWLVPSLEPSPSCVAATYVPRRFVHEMPELIKRFPCFSGCPHEHSGTFMYSDPSKAQPRRVRAPWPNPISKEMSMARTASASLTRRSVVAGL